MFEESNRDEAKTNAKFPCIRNNIGNQLLKFGTKSKLAYTMLKSTPPC